jgi:hypothetical protein
MWQPATDGGLYFRIDGTHGSLRLLLRLLLCLLRLLASWRRIELALFGFLFLAICLCAGQGGVDCERESYLVDFLQHTQYMPHPSAPILCFRYQPREQWAHKDRQ